MTGRGRGRTFRRGGRGRAGAAGRSQSGKWQKVRSITPKDAPDLVEWLTTNTTTIYPPLESQELFSDPSEEISDAQPFLALDQEEAVATAATQQSDDSIQISPRRLVPAVAAYSEISNVSGGEGDVDDDVSTDVTWVPTREEEEGSSEGEMDQQIGGRSRPNLHCTGGTN